MNNLFLDHYILNVNKQFGKIFLIDDDDIDNKVFSVFAEKTKLTKNLVKFRDPVHALSHIRSMPISNAPDAIFIDLHMPIMNGWELVEELEGCKKLLKTKIFIITSSVWSGHKKKLKEKTTVTDLLIKPIGIHKMLEIKGQYA